MEIPQASSLRRPAAAARFAMATVAPSDAPALPSEAQALVSKLSAPMKAAAEKKKVKVRMTVYDSKNKELWYDEVDGTPAMMKGIAAGKAYSYLHGEKLKDPGQCDLMCNIMLPWACGCKKGVNVQGTVGIELPGTDAACICVNGCPKAHDDLIIVEEALAAAGFAKKGTGVWATGGAPPAAEMSR